MAKVILVDLASELLKDTLNHAQVKLGTPRDCQAFQVEMEQNGEDLAEFCHDLRLVAAKYSYLVENSAGDPVG